MWAPGRSLFLLTCLVCACHGQFNVQQPTANLQQGFLDRQLSTNNNAFTEGFYSSNGQSDQQSRLRPKKWGIDYKGNLAQIQSNWIPNTRNFQAQPVPGDCFTTIPGCQRCELTPTGPVCWQCLFNFKQTSFVLSQTLGFPTGFCVCPPGYGLIDPVLTPSTPCPGQDVLQSQCMACPINSTSTGGPPGQVVCTPCPAGTITPSVGFPSCVTPPPPCPPPPPPAGLPAASPPPPAPSPPPAGAAAPGNTGPVLQPSGFSSGAAAAVPVTSGGRVAAAAVPHPNEDIAAVSHGRRLRGASHGRGM